MRVQRASRAVDLLPVGFQFLLRLKFESHREVNHEYYELRKKRD